MEKPKYLVLIDDDKPTNIYHDIIIQEAELGVEYKIYNSAIDALEELKSSNRIPDYIFLDINMPKMNGWEFLEEYTKLPGSSITPVVIMLTTSLSSHDKKKYEKMPLVKGFISKPLSEECLKDTLVEQ